MHMHTYTLREYSDALSFTDSNGYEEFMNGQFWLTKSR